MTDEGWGSSKVNLWATRCLYVVLIISTWEAGNALLAYITLWELGADVDAYQGYGKDALHDVSVVLLASFAICAMKRASSGRNGGAPSHAAH